MPPAVSLLDATHDTIVVYHLPLDHVDSGQCPPLEALEAFGVGVGVDIGVGVDVGVGVVSSGADPTVRSRSGFVPSVWSRLSPSWIVSNCGLSKGRLGQNLSMQLMSLVHWGMGMGMGYLIYNL